MSFNGLQPASGPFFLAPGASMRIWVRRNGGQDFGAQWIMAHPLRNGQPPTELVVSDHSKLLQYEIGTITINGPAEYGYDPDSSYYEYRVTVRNAGTQGTLFNVQGGGNV
jgi:hypothetical protein